MISGPDTKSVETRVESRFDTFWRWLEFHNFVVTTMFSLAIPLAASPACNAPYIALVPASFRAIEVSKSGVQCVSCRGSRQGSVGNEGAEAEGGHVTRSVVERHSRQPKISTFNHGVITFFWKTFDQNPCHSKRLHPARRAGKPWREEPTNPWTSAAISSAAVSRAKWPPSTMWTSALGTSRR